MESMYFTEKKTDLIVQNYNGFNVTFQNGNNVMVNLTDMVKAFPNKNLSKIINSQEIQDYCNSLSRITNVILTDLVQVRNGGSNNGTWANRKVALRVAQKLSPDFAVWVDTKIEELLISGSTSLNYHVPQTYSEALKLASVQAEQIEEQNQQIKKMLPRSEFVDVVFNTDKLLQGSEVCKLLNLPFGNVTLYKRLREEGVFFKDKNEPMQRYVDAGYFRLKEEYVPNLENFIIRAYFTQKGLGFIAKKFNALQSFALLQNPQI